MTNISPTSMDIRQDTLEGKFYIDIKGKKEAYLQYTLHTDAEVNVVDFNKLVIPKILDGIGIEEEMAMKGIRFAEKCGYQVKATCPFMKGWLSRHPEFNHLRVK